MLEKKMVYRCPHCGNIVEGLWNGTPAVQCCGSNMEKLEANTTDAATEKHVPVIEKDGNKVTVKVGEVAHPMAGDHYILFIELLVGNKVYRQDLVEGDSDALATFLIEESDTDLVARAYCNKHGFWASK